MVPMPKGGGRGGGGLVGGSALRVGWVLPLGLALILVLLFNEELGMQQALDLSTSGYMAETSTGAVDSLAWAEMVWAETFDDGVRLTELRNRGLIFTVEKGTRVEIVGFGLSSRKVRPLDGNGTAGWVPGRAVSTR